MARPRSKQPIREAPASYQGERQANAQLQAQAPLAAPPAPGEGTAPLPSPGGAGGAAPPAPPGATGLPPNFSLPSDPNVFGPASSPTSNTETILPDDQYGVLRALYRLAPNDDLRRLIERAGNLSIRPKL